MGSGGNGFRNGNSFIKLSQIGRKVVTPCSQFSLPALAFIRFKLKPVCFVDFMDPFDYFTQQRVGSLFWRNALKPCPNGRVLQNLARRQARRNWPNRFIPFLVENMQDNRPELSKSNVPSDLPLPVNHQRLKDRIVQFARVFLRRSGSRLRAEPHERYPDTSDRRVEQGGAERRIAVPPGFEPVMGRSRVRRYPCARRSTPPCRKLLQGPRGSSRPSGFRHEPNFLASHPFSNH